MSDNAAAAAAAAAAVDFSASEKKQEQLTARTSDPAPPGSLTENYYAVQLPANAPPRDDDFSSWAQRLSDTCWITILRHGERQCLVHIDDKIDVVHYYCVAKFVDVHSSRILCLTVSCCENFIATASEDGTVVVWTRGRRSVVDVKHPFVPLRTKSLRATAATTTSAGAMWTASFDACLNGATQLAYGGDSGEVMVLENLVEFGDKNKDAQPRLRTLRGHTGPVMDVAWSPGNSYLASASADATIIIWNAKANSPKAAATTTATQWCRLATLRGHTDVVRCVAFFPYSDPEHRLLSGSNDGTVRVWDLHITQAKPAATASSSSSKQLKDNEQQQQPEQADFIVKDLPIRHPTREDVARLLNTIFSGVNSGMVYSSSILGLRRTRISKPWVSNIYFTIAPTGNNMVAICYSDRDFEAYSVSAFLSPLPFQSRGEASFLITHAGTVVRGSRKLRSTFSSNITSKSSLASKSITLSYEGQGAPTYSVAPAARGHAVNVYSPLRGHRISSWFPVSEDLASVFSSGLGRVLSSLRSSSSSAAATAAASTAKIHVSIVKPTKASVTLARHDDIALFLENHGRKLMGCSYRFTAPCASRDVATTAAAATATTAWSTENDSTSKVCDWKNLDVGTAVEATGATHAPDKSVSHMDVSRDGQRLVTVGFDGKLCVWSVDSEGIVSNLLPSPITVSGVELYCAAFTDDIGSQFVTGTTSGNLMFFKVIRQRFFIAPTSQDEELRSEIGWGVRVENNVKVQDSVGSCKRCIFSRRWNAIIVGGEREQLQRSGGSSSSNTATNVAVCRRQNGGYDWVVTSKHAASQCRVSSLALTPDESYLAVGTRSSGAVLYQLHLPDPDEQQDQQQQQQQQQGVQLRPLCRFELQYPNTVCYSIGFLRGDATDSNELVVVAGMGDSTVTCWSYNPVADIAAAAADDDNNNSKKRLTINNLCSQRIKSIRPSCSERAGGGVIGSIHTFFDRNLILAMDQYSRFAFLRLATRQHKEAVSGENDSKWQLNSEKTFYIVSAGNWTFRTLGDASRIFIGSKGGRLWSVRLSIRTLQSLAECSISLPPDGDAPAEFYVAEYAQEQRAIKMWTRFKGAAASSPSLLLDTKPVLAKRVVANSNEKSIELVDL